MLIATDEEFASFIDRASASEVVGIDTEFVREKTYYPRLCLIQLGTDSEQVAVDPFAVSDPAPLVRLFSNPFVTKVFHACSQDMEVLLRWCGTLPRPLFDTQVAVAFLEDRSQMGYGALVEECCHVDLPKAESMSDWARRPLDDAQLAYALDDVRYLPAIWRSLRGRLDALGRMAWATPEFERLADPGAYVQDPRESFRRVKRIGTLSGRRQLSVAREVAAWRERKAAEIDRPRRWVLSDEMLVEIARRTPDTMEGLTRIRGFADVAPSDRAQVLEACRAGLACPIESCPSPEHHARPTVEEESVCDLMYALTRTVAEREGMAPSLLASRDDLFAFLSNRVGSPLSRGWRREVLGEALERLLAGEIGLTVKDGRVELL